MFSKLFFTKNTKPLFLSLHNPNDYIPKTSLYTLFFKQNQRQFPKKLFQSIVTSYFGGVVFGGMMLGLTLINNVGLGGMDFLSESTDKDYKFQSTKDFFDNCKYQLRSLHQNGTFVIKYTLFMGVVNAVSIYFPILNSNFDDLYGLKNLHFICNYALPTAIWLNCSRAPLLRKLLYISLFPCAYFVTAKTKKRIEDYMKKRKQMNNSSIQLI